MSATLVHNSYGKSQVRLTKVTRHADRHDLKELSVNVRLEGDFIGSYVGGDNTRVIATDSMKNIVYVCARQHRLDSIESFGQAVAEHFFRHYGHVSRIVVELVEEPWQRLAVKGQEHPHAFMGGGREKRTATVTQTRAGVTIEAGLDDLLLLKTTDSAFKGFICDQFTTLRETDDRIFATVLTARWLYRQSGADWDADHRRLRQALLETFVGHKSLSVQQTLYAMGQAALDACPAMEQITLRMPNRHRILVALERFDLDNQNEVFVPTDEPFGLIEGTLRRD